MKPIQQALLAVLIMAFSAACPPIPIDPDVGGSGGKNNPCDAAMPKKDAAAPKADASAPVDATSSTHDATLPPAPDLAPVVDATVPIARLTVATIAIQSVLVNGMNTTYKFSATASLNDDIDLKRFTLQNLNYGVVVGAQRSVYENGVPLDSSHYTITDGGNSANPTIVVDFVTSRTVSAGTTKVYALPELASQVVPGSSTTRSLLEDDQATPVLSANFVWRPSSTGDWLNGNQVRGLPTTPAVLSL